MSEFASFCVCMSVSYAIGITYISIIGLGDYDEENNDK